MVRRDTVRHMGNHNSDATVALSPDPILSATEAAAYLRVSRTTFYRILQKQDIASVTVGARRRFRRSALEAYLQGGVSASNPAA